MKDKKRTEKIDSGMSKMAILLFRSPFSGWGKAIKIKSMSKIKNTQNYNTLTL